MHLFLKNVKYLENQKCNKEHENKKKFESNPTNVKPHLDIVRKVHLIK